MNDDVEWFEFSVKGPVDVVRYRVSTNAHMTCEFWSDHKVPGMARQGWNRTKSHTVRMLAGAELKRAGK